MIASLVEHVTGASRLARAAHAWRDALFTDLDLVADCLPALPPYTEILDLSADRGALLDRVLARNPGTRATIVDPSPAGPSAIELERRHRVVWQDAAEIDAWRAARPQPPDVVLLSDVLHHVPPDSREEFLTALRPELPDGALLVIKELAPGSLRARMAWLADCCLSGDAGLRFLAPFELRALAARVFPERAAIWTPLFRLDPPSYCFVFAQLKLADAGATGRVV